MLSGPFVVASALLALAGLFKVRRPAPTARALSSVGLGGLARLARPLGAAELAVGAGALAVDSRLLAALVAAFYAGFAGFVLLAMLRPTPAADCGCFGATESPPTLIHLVLDLAAAGVAVAVAVRGGGTSVVSALADQPLAGVPFLLAAVTCAALAYAALTILARTSAEVRR